ncbi:spore coat polysaccharide biosynthesis protein SpsF [Paenibacillus albidus]|uniref:Spore coat polysaccharide biosynthesis protein SpsF n=1 Tax=Paenibacillus albidus TaxID=2041023 RepID=A0A917FKB1_9BACL|nr:glycosyltransferase family protein [Paenibacillus albidus]GGF87755.1 spore coat polysaccharide biosynthesis protein SpsF [Paenibacillus albidus]
MNFVAIIQARMGSTRLPGKVLMPLGDTCILDYVVARCQKIQKVSQVVVATSILKQDDDIENWCELNGVSCFRGSEEDVLERYYVCAQKYKADYILRVTADCPFVDYELASLMIEAMITNPSDILLYEGQIPRGLAVEVISLQALEKVNLQGTESRHREHVTYYAYENKDNFTCVSLNLPKYLDHPQLRITVDTSEDYEVCQLIAEKFVDNKTISSAEVIQYLLNSPEVSEINAHIEQKPVI